MERGIDPPYYRTSSRAAPTWSKLVKDLKRSRTKAKAAELLEYRVPMEAVEWLRNRIFFEDWLLLRSLGRDGDDEIAAAALAEARKWEAAQPKSPQPKPDPEPDGSGDPDSGAGLKP